MGLHTMAISDVEATVYYGDLKQDRYFVKISFIGTGVHINSFSVTKSQFNDGWWVQPPKHRQGQRWTSTVDFDKSYPLWEEIEKRAIRAVELYKNGGESGVEDKPITLEDIPF